ncbi:MAG: hypothetical protein HYX24_06225 [Candidatus Aenigmarchaeota archaeon]|nr:hypothetical protein [Candidatus Aenigmarchaeota archaeon]
MTSCTSEFQLIGRIQSTNPAVCNPLDGRKFFVKKAVLAILAKAVFGMI